MLETPTLATFAIGGFCALLALGLSVEARSRSFRGAMATIVAVILLAAAVAYLDLASKRIPTVTMAHAGPAPAVSVAHEEQAPVSQMVCVRGGRASM